MRLAKLLRLASSNDPTQLTSLEDYVARMKEDQKQIYFLSGAGALAACVHFCMQEHVLWLSGGAFLQCHRPTFNL